MIVGLLDQSPHNFTQNLVNTQSKFSTWFEPLISKPKLQKVLEKLDCLAIQTLCLRGCDKKNWTMFSFSDRKVKVFYMTSHKTFNNFVSLRFPIKNVPWIPIISLPVEDFPQLGLHLIPKNSSQPFRILNLTNFSTTLKLFIK